MTDKPEIGKTLWNQEINRGRRAAAEARRALLRIVDEQTGPAATGMLLTKAGVLLGDIEAVFSRLDEIGREAKNETKRTLKTK